MFKNKSFIVTPVNTDVAYHGVSDGSNDADVYSQDRAGQINTVAETVIAGGAVLMAVYFLGDTLRGLVTHVALTKIK